MLSAAHHVEVVGASDEGDAAAAGVDEVLGGLLGGLVAIGRHAGEAFGQAGAAEEDERDAHGGYLVEVAVVCGVLGEAGDDALDVEADEIVDSAHFSLAVLMGIGTDDGIARLASLILDAVENGRIVMRHQIGDYHPDDPRGFLAEALGKGVRPIVHLLGEFLDSLLHLVPDFRTAAQGTADSGYADAQLPGQILK